MTCKYFIISALAAFAMSYQTDMLKAECKVNLRVDSQQGTQELLIGNVEAKVAESEGILKLRVFGAFDTFAWAFAKLDKGAARISAFYNRDGMKIFVAQALGIKVRNKINWAVFKCDDCSRGSASGTAFFIIDGKQYCENYKKREWEDAVFKVFGDAMEDIQLLAQEPDHAYRQIGLGY